MSATATKLFDNAFEGFYKNASDGLKLQQEMLAAYSRFWPGFTGRQDGETTVQGLREQWGAAIKNLAQTQYNLLDQQMDAALNFYGTLVDAAFPPVAPVAVKPAPVPEKPPASEVKSAPVQAAQPVVVPPASEVPLPEAVYRPEFAKNIHQKVAVVTGAASGIGEAVTRELVRRGAKGVILVDRNDLANELAASLNKEAGRDVALAMVGDTTDEGFRKRVFNAAEEQFGVVTICVPAAGITRDSLAVRVDKETGKAEVYPLETFRQVTEVNLLAPIYWGMEMVARIAEDRARRGLKRWEPEESVQGNIVFLGSVSSQGNKGQISYAVAKAGLEGATATLAKEAIFHGVRCGIIHPGFTDTPMARALGEDFLNKYVLPFTQLRRLIKPEEIADAICFMISNSAVSGELWADAGWHPPA